MKTVRQLLGEKGRQVWSIQPTDSVYDAIKMMADREIGALIVTEGGQMVGIITERDYARKVILVGKSSRETPVGDIMTTEVVRGKLDLPVDHGLALMTEKRIRHLPIFDETNLVGIISIGDLVRSIIEEQKFVIEQLEHYIAG
ncbi:MAG: CBS domain-containing protein [Gammaproteobacteria bacterium]|nr:CBS domain-containing protein [Gammaproteobacteria bacterium]